MSAARRLAALPIVVGCLAALALLGAGLILPFEVRDSAPAGYSHTLDPKRGIAVSGGRVTINYPNFNRVDLDLRAYNHKSFYDLTVHIRRDVRGAPDIRSIPLGLPGTRIEDDKPDFADPFVTVRFPPIADSAGRRYYVWVERGPRNQDDVLALWSIKSYSRVTGRMVLGALLDHPPGDAAPGLVRLALVVLMLALVGAFGWLMAALSALALSRLGLAARGGGVVALGDG